MTQRNNRSKEEVAGIIKSILVADKKSSTIGVPVAQLEDEYRAQDGTRIPYRLFGYACLMDFLESLQRKGEIVIGKRGSMHVVFLCVDEKIAHVSALVSGQKDTGRRCSRGGKRNTPRYYPRQFYQPPMLDSKTLADVLRLIKNAPNGMHVSRIIEYLKDRNHFNVDEDRLMRQLREISHEISIEHGMIYPIMKKQVNSPPKNINSTNRTNSAPAYGPAGLSDNEEDNETFEFVRKCDDVQPVKNPNQFNEESKRPLNSVQIPNADFPENRNSRVDHDNEDIGILVNSRTRFRLEKLIQKHPNGIWCAELPNFYHKEYSIPLNYEELGFGNLSDFAANLPDIFHCVRLQEHGDFKLFDAKGPKPERRQNPRPEQLSLAALHNLYESYHDEVEPVPVLLSPTTSQRLVPEGVMTIGETVAQICVTQLFSDNTPHIDVIVVDTVTPTFFWIQILKKTQKFDRFMHDLHEFYSENASKYIMPIVVLERGLNCACIYDKQWHRGVIKAVKPNNTVTVLFYDYGTVLTYPPQDIHFLHRSFSSLPAQAIPCGLYNVKPIATEKWPYSVCQVFAEKVLNVPMVAMLGSIDPDNNSMLIALTNTEDVADFHISDWMISSGFAVYGKMVCIRPPNYPFRHYLECKHGIISYKDKNTSDSNRIIINGEKSSAFQALLPVSNENLATSSFYETLIKLRRKSGKNSLEMSSNHSSCDSRVPRDESRTFNAETSQPVLTASKIVVTEDNANDKKIIRQNVEESSSQNKNFGTSLLKELCEFHENKMTTANVATSESDLNESKSLNGASSSSASVILPGCKDINIERNYVSKIQENPEISPIPKRFANLARIAASKGFKPIVSSTKSNETSNGEQKPTKPLLDTPTKPSLDMPTKPSLDTPTKSSLDTPTKPSLDTPLHLRPEIAERRKGSSKFNAFYSEIGGHGLMEPIDWNKLRNGGTFDANENDALQENPPTASTPLAKHAKLNELSAFENNQKSIPPNSSNIQFDNRSEASIEINMKTREKTSNSEQYTTKFNRDTEKSGNKTTRKRSYEDKENNEEKSLDSRYRDLPKSHEKYSIKRYLELSISEEKASKPRAWNVPKTEEHWVKRNPEMVNSLESKNQDEIFWTETHGKSLASRHRETSKTQTKYSGRSTQEIGNSEGKPLAFRHRETSKSRTKHSGKNNKKTANSGEITSNPGAKVSRTISTSVAENLPSTNATTKLASKKSAFLNLVRGRMENKDTPPDFGHFHSILGGSGRLETIDWNESRELASPKKTESPKKEALKIDKKTPVKKREPVGKGFFNIVNSALPPPSERDILCVPNGNIMRQSELSPNLRSVLKGINEDVGDKQLRLFIPDDIAELLENDDSTSVSSSFSDSEANKCTVKYRSFRKPIASLESRSSSDTIPDSTGSEYSSAANDSRDDFDSTNEASGIMSGNASKSGERLLKSTDTSATASQPSPAAARGDNERITQYIHASESNADEGKVKSPKAEKIGRDNVRKRVDFGAESRLIRNPKSSETSLENCLLKSADFCKEERDEKPSRSGEKLGKFIDTSEIASHTKPEAARGDDERISHNGNISQSNTDEEKTKSPKAEKIGRDKGGKLVDFNAESRLVQNLKSSGTSLDNGLSKSVDFRQEKRNVKCDSLSELTDGEEKKSEERFEIICRENVKNRIDSIAERISLRRSLSSVATEESHTDDSLSNDKKLTKERKIGKMRVASTDSISDGSEKIAAATGAKTTNAWIQNSSLKTNDSLFTNFLKFFGSRNDSADNSDLDSDDLSTEESYENVSTQLKKSTDDDHSLKLESFANEINKSLDESSQKMFYSNDDQSSLRSDFTTEKLDAVVFDKEPRVLKGIDHRDNNESENSAGSGKDEKSICLPTNTETFSVKLANEDTEAFPYYDDTCVVSDEDEWDFAPATGSLYPRDIDSEHRLINRNSYGKIDAPSEHKKTATWKDSNSENVDDLSPDQQKNELGADCITSIHDDSTYNNENADSDEHSIQINESLENNPNNANDNGTPTVCTQNSHSILGEVQKLNISATTNAFTYINSNSSCSSSSSSKTESHAKSLMSALKEYL